MSTRNTTTTSGSTSTSSVPWGPVQAPLEKSIDLIDPMIGDVSLFTPSNPEQFEQGFQLLDDAAKDANYGRDYFQPLNVSQQYAPLMGGAQYDQAAGAQKLNDVAAGSGQVYNQGQADQWDQWRDDYLGNGENPHLDQIISQSQDEALNKINQQFTGAGRSYNSGAYGNVAADRLGRIATEARFADYNRRYDQERAAFEQQTARSQQQGLDAGKQLYGQSANTILQGANTLDERERQEILDRDRINKDRAALMLEQGGLRQQLDTQLNLDPTLKSAAWPIQLLSSPGAAFSTKSGTTSGAQSQPNTGFWPGVAQTGLGILGGFF